jgi:light-regulated signal transduction histidine kinase (bacteriophytochrome)
VAHNLLWRLRFKREQRRDGLVTTGERRWGGDHGAHSQENFPHFHPSASRDKIESTGVELAILKKLVGDRGGRVRGESEP